MSRLLTRIEILEETKNFYTNHPRELKNTYNPKLKRWNTLYNAPMRYFVQDNFNNYPQDSSWEEFWTVDLLEFHNNNEFWVGDNFWRSDEYMKMFPDNLPRGNRLSKKGLDFYNSLKEKYK